MTVKASSNKTVILEMDEATAHWLKCVLQNPIGTSYENEISEDKFMRQDLFNAISEELME